MCRQCSRTNFVAACSAFAAMALTLLGSSGRELSARLMGIDVIAERARRRADWLPGEVCFGGWASQFGYNQVLDLARIASRDGTEVAP